MIRKDETWGEDWHFGLLNGEDTLATDVSPLRFGVFVANIYSAVSLRALACPRVLGLMNLMLAGLSHKTASVEVRERFAISERRIPEALTKLRAEAEIQEALILSTCNRVEFVVRVREDCDGLEALRRFAGSFYGPAYNEHAPFFYVYYDYEALRHLFRVASGLDSMVVGEPQVLGQVSRRSG